jgi:hypothetical protein
LFKKEPVKTAARLFSFIYKFYSPVTKYFYILHADYHEGDFFAVKFYCKKDRHSDFKYSKIINKGDVGNILMTCVKVIPLLLNDYPEASFGFIGSRTVDEISRKVESFINNQRFRIYRQLIPLKFGQKTFAHFEQISGYLLINRRCDDIKRKEKELIRMLAATYNNLPDIS